MEQLQAFDGDTCGTSDLTDVLGFTAAPKHVVGLSGGKDSTALAAELEAQIEALKLEVEALRQDAERYRWLRNKSPGQYEQPIVVTQARSSCASSSGDHMRYIGPLAFAHLDAAIDAAMKEAK